MNRLNFNLLRSSRECQLAAWRQGHKVRCKELQATARAAKAAQAAATKKAPEADEVAPVPDKVLYPYDKFLSFFKAKDTCNKPPTGLANCGCGPDAVPVTTKAYMARQPTATVLTNSCMTAGSTC